MLKVNNARTMGWEGAIRGMRNPLNSWDKNDSCFLCGEVTLGENDLKLCKALIKAGSSDRKFLRMIHVQVDVTAPLYWWKEASTYKVSTVENSTSTMHKIHSRDLIIDDFSAEHLNESSRTVLLKTIQEININRRQFKETNDKDCWWQMIQLLPSSYNQTRTWDLNYETLMNIYFQRHNHKLDEWHDLCGEILKLPYMKEFIEVLMAKNKGE